VIHHLLMPKESYRALSDEQRAWVRALELHLRWRFEQNRHAPLDSGGETFLTVSHVQKLLRCVGAPRRGEAEAIAWWQDVDLIQDTGKMKKPELNPSRLAAREHFGQGTVRSEGGRDAQPSSSRSYWWRVFVIVPIARVLAAYARMQGAYGRFGDVPHDSASLSAFLRRQGLIPCSRPRRTVRPGSVQWVFAHSGPP
jgi:hypothetical protein